MTDEKSLRPGDPTPVQSTHTPTVDGWAVSAVPHAGGVWTTIFSVGVQHFEITRAEADDPNAEEHCRWFARMFTQALDARDRLRSEAPPTCITCKRRIALVCGTCSLEPRSADAQAKGST